MCNVCFMTPCRFGYPNAAEPTPIFHCSRCKEMSVLIDGTISECKEQGIETLTSEELERLLTSWKT